LSLLDATLITGVLAMTLRMATPLIYGTVGETFSERAGILNLGIEGMMLMGASIGFLVGFTTGDLWLGVAAAALTGLVLGLVMAFLTVSIGAQQHVAGLGLTIACSGFSFYIYRISVANVGGVAPHVEPFATIPIPYLSQIPIIGEVLFNQHALAYIGLILVPVSAFVLFRTRFGLSLRAVGENPNAAATAGIDVFKMRYISLIIAGVLSAIGGAWLSLAQSGMFLPGLTQGRGWVCIALVVFANWMPYRVLGGAILFGGIDAVQLSLQGVGWNIPYQLFLMLPYVLTIVALVAVSRRARAPAALLLSYKRED
jgi:simple sugar transport system permease protein